MPVSGPSPYIGKKIESWAFNPEEYSGFTPPESPEVAPSQYMPGPVSSLLAPDEFKAIAKHTTQFGSGLRPTTSWADVVDSSTRAAQRRERGTATQPSARPEPEQPGSTDGPAEDPAAAVARAAAVQKAQAARAKVQQAQKVRQAAEQEHTIVRDRLDGLQLSVQKAADRVKQIQDDLEEWRDDNPGLDPPDDMEEDLDQAKSDLDESQKQLTAAQAEAQAAAEAVQEAANAEDAANKEYAQAEQEQQAVEQQAQTTAEQRPQQQPATEGTAPSPYDQVGQEIGRAVAAPSAEPGQPGAVPGQSSPDADDPIARSIAQVKAAGGSTDNLLQTIASEAWKIQSGRDTPDWANPDEVKAYDEYREAWKGAYLAGQDVPLAAELRAAANAPRGQTVSPARNPGTYDPNQSPSPTNQPPVNPALIGGPDRPPLAGPDAAPPQPGTVPPPGVGTPTGAGPAASAIPAAPGTPAATPTPAAGAPGAANPNLTTAQETLAAAQARDAELRKQMGRYDDQIKSAEKKMEAAQEEAKKLSNELSSGAGSPEYRQYSLTPALNAAQGRASDAAQQVASLRAKAAQAQQVLAASQQSIVSAQNLVRIASVPVPGAAGPAATTAKVAGDTAQAQNVLQTLLARATPEQQRRLLLDVVNGGAAGTEVLRKVAEAAWYRQLADQGQQPTPGGPPRDYIESWMGMFRAGETSAPLIAAVKAELQRRGVYATAGAGRTSDPRDNPAGQPYPQTPAGTVPGKPQVLDPRDVPGGNPAPQVAAAGPVTSAIPGYNPDPNAPSVNGSAPAPTVTGPNGEQLIFIGNGYYSDGKGKVYQRKPDGTVVDERGQPVTPGSTPAGGPATSVLSGPPEAQSGYTPQPMSLTASGAPLTSKGDLAGEQFSWKTAPAPPRLDQNRPTDPGAPAGVVAPPPQLKPDQARLWNEWSTADRAAGGNGNDWERFRKHAVAVGAPDPGGSTAPQVAGRAIAPPKVSSDPTPVAPGAPLAINPGAAAKIDPIVVSGRVAGVQDEQGQQQIANGINGWIKGDPNAAWAQAHVENAARVDWHLHTGGRPEDAPADYVANWVAEFKGGKAASPMQEQLNNSLRSRGITPPVDAVLQADWRNAIRRIGQGDPNAYSNPANARAMVEYACSAASVSVVVNAINPEANAKIDDVIAKMGPGLINPQQGLLLGSDMGPLARVLTEYGVESKAQNFTAQSLQEHFANGGGPVIMSGPGWSKATGQNFPHIYVVTGADANGVQIVDSASKNLPSLTWAQWQTATGGPANGAGLYAVARTGTPANAAQRAPTKPGFDPAVPPTATPAATPGRYEDIVVPVKDGGQPMGQRYGVIPKNQDNLSYARQVAQTAGLDPDLVERIIMAESNGNPNAVSGAGARGIMQVMPGTEQEQRDRYGITETGVHGNIQVGVTYLVEILKMNNGDVARALGGYNAGPYRNPNSWPGETHEYIRKIMEGYSGDGRYHPR